MKNLGDKLLQARTAMGLSVRDAADATRLRADVIENMESGDFNFNLPEIYKRGFLRVYAAFLKLDVDTVMEQYTIGSKGFGEDVKRKTNILSRMATAANVSPSLSPSPQKEFDAPQSSLESRFEAYDKAADEQQSEQPDASAKFIKMAAVFGAVILAVVVIILIVSSIVSKKAPEENPDIQMNANMPTQAASPSAPQASAQSAAAVNEVANKELALALTAISDTYVLVYPDVKTPDGKPAEVLYIGPMQAGERREFRSPVPLMVKLTDAERVKIERNGNVLDLKGAKGLRLFRVVSK